MAGDFNWDEAGAWPQLATRIPKELHRALKQRAVEDEVSMMKLVIEGIQLRLQQRQRGPK